MSTLTKDRDSRMFAGVCAGLANYIAIDVTWVRLAFILLGLASGLGTALYIVLALLLPLPEDSDRPTAEIVRANVQDLGDIVESMFDSVYEGTGQNRFVAAGLITLGIILLFSQFGWVSSGWVLAAGLILLGSYIFYRRGSGK